MENCTTCKYAIFDEQWGKYKCSKRGTRVYILLDSEECKFFEKEKK